VRACAPRGYDRGQPIILCRGGLYRLYNVSKGWHGLFKGLSPNLVRVILLVLLSFIHIEQLAHIITFKWGS